MTTNRLYNLLLILLTILVLATIGVLLAEPLTDGDIWFHLAYGRYFIENHTIIPDHSVFSWTPTDNSQIYCAWISESIFYLLHKVGGLSSLYALRYLSVIVFLMAVASISVRNRTVFLPVYLLICLSGIIMSRWGLYIKSELFSFMIMALMVWTWFRIKTRPDKNPYLFYLFPLLMLIWVNSHGGFIFGIVFLGLVFVGEVVNWLTGSSEKLDPQNRKNLFIAIILSGLAVLITPYGWGYPIQLINNLFLNPDALHRHMGNIRAYNSIFDPRTLQLSLIENLITSVGILIILLFIEIRRRKIDWTLIIINAAFVIIYMRYLRATYYWAIVFVFSAAYLIRKISKDDLKLTLNKPLKLIINTTIIILLLIIAVQVQYQIINHGFNHDYSSPVTEAEYIHKKFPNLRIGNDYACGSYLLWSLWPENKVFIDARYFPYKTLYDEYNEFCFRDDSAIKESFINKYNCDLWCVTYSFAQIKYFMESPDWNLVFYGPSACIFLSKRIPYPEGHEVSSSIFKADTSHALYLSSFAIKVGDPDVSKRLLAKAKISPIYQQDQDRINAIESAIDQQEKQIRNDIMLMEYALMTNPSDLQLIQKLVLSYAKIGDYENAIANLKKILKQNPGKPDVYYNIACMYARMGKIDESITWLDLSMKKGFNNWSFLEQDPDLDNIHRTIFYKRLIRNH